MRNKFLECVDIENYEILTDTGYQDICKLHKTIEYDVFLLKTESFELKCADSHIVFDEYFNEVFVKDLKNNLLIQTENGLEKIISVQCLGYKENMYDFELIEDTNHRYLTNGILSHNTHTAKMLAKELFDDENALIEVNMNEYGDKISISRLIGAAPGYIGYEESGELTKKIKNKPYCVVLLDEIEKAHPDVLNLFIQAFREGKMTDSQGYVIDFRNVLFILTSNIGTQHLKDFGTGIGFSSFNKENNIEKEKAILLKELEKTLKTEILNRIDNVIVYNSLTKENLHQIIDLNIKDLNERLIEHSLILKIDESVKNLILKESDDEKYGAAVIERTISSLIEDSLAELILNGIEPKSIIKATVKKDKITYSILTS